MRNLTRNHVGNNKINTSSYEGIIKEVLIDDRENQRVEYALKQYAPFNPVKKHLPIGDYIFKGENGVNVVFEYKTGADFLNSITENNHLHNQTYDMITNYEYCFIIIESKDLKQELNNLYYKIGKEIGLNQINGAIAEFNTVSTVLQTQTQYQAFDLMMRMSGKIITQKPFRYKYGKKTPNQALNWLSAMSGLDKTAEKIVQTLNINTLEDILNLTSNDLLTVPKIGEKKASKILQNIKENWK